MKQTIFQCITALLCVIAVSVTGSISVGKIADAKKEAAKAAAENVQSADNIDEEFNSENTDDNTDGQQAEQDNEAPSQDASSDGEAAPDSSDDSSAPSQQGSEPTKQNESTPSKNNASKPSAPSTAAEITAYYNKAVNKAVSAKAGFSKQRTTTLSNLDGSGLLKLKEVVDAVNGFLGVGTVNYKNTKGKAGEISKAALTAADVTSAKCTASGDIYTVTMSLRNGKSSASASSSSDSSPLSKTGLYSGKGDKTAYDYKNSENIYAGINNVDLASVESVTENTKNAKVTAKINAKTGNLVSITVSYDWDVSLTNVKYIIKVSGASGNAKTTASFSNFVF